MEPSDGPPDLPQHRPPTGHGRNVLIKQVAQWLYRGAHVAVRVSPLGRLINAYEAGLWIYDHWSHIAAHLDEPKTLQELRSAASQPKTGYDVHHIVEKTPALKDNIDPDKVNSPDNLVLIPTLKHWEINSWFETRNPNYNWLTPRMYVRGKTWEERFKVGLEALIEAEVLKP